jgi:hypothetical protein
MIPTSSRLWLTVGTVVAAALTFGVAGVLPARSQSEIPRGPQSLESVVGQSIGYQGYLTDNTGSPLTGTYPMRFELYEAASGGGPLYNSGAMNVTVNEGLFNVSLNVPHSVVDGKSLWLAIIVNNETLSPRQEIRPAPYALSLRPGAVVRQAATGTAVRVESTEGIGLQGTGRVYGVYGTTAGASQGAGYGGYFTSSTGIGVHGQSTAQPSVQNLFAPGVSGYSQHGVGIYGGAATGFGVYGSTPGSGVGGVGNVYGVYGASSATTQGRGYGGYFASSTGIGVHGRSTAQSSSQNQFAPGVSGYSQHGAGVMGASGPSGAAGYFDGTVFVDGNLIVTGSKGGYLVDIAVNDGAEALTRGDLVVVTGVADPVVGEIPVPLVRKADSPSSTAVIGIVDAAYRTDQENEVNHLLSRRLAAAVGEVVGPGDYLSIVTLGAFGALNVDASYGAIRPGDLLVSSPMPGHAMRAENPGIGTVIGKALGGLESGTGTIAVMVALQ